MTIDDQERKSVDRTIETASPDRKQPTARTSKSSFVNIFWIPLILLIVSLVGGAGFGAAQYLIERYIGKIEKGRDEAIAEAGRWRDLYGMLSEKMPIRSQFGNGLTSIEFFPISTTSPVVFGSDQACGEEHCYIGFAELQEGGKKLRVRVRFVNPDADDRYAYWRLTIPIDTPCTAVVHMPLGDLRIAIEDIRFNQIVFGIAQTRRRSRGTDDPNTIPVEIHRHCSPERVVKIPYMEREAEGFSELESIFMPE